MESRLKQLFEYQRFEDNADLRAVINDVHSRYGAGARQALTLEEADWVNAAGTPEMDAARKDMEKKRL